MFSVPESIALCILWRTPLLLLPTNSSSLTSKSRHHPPNTFIMLLYCFISYPWYFCFNSQRSSPYFVLFSSPFLSRFVTHGQLISSVTTRFDSWLLMRAWTLLAPTSRCSANRGHPRTLTHCSPRTLASVSVASTKVVPTLQVLGLAKSRRKVSSGLHYVR